MHTRKAHLGWSGGPAGPPLGPYWGAQQEAQHPASLHYFPWDFTAPAGGSQPPPPTTAQPGRSPWASNSVSAKTFVFP